MSGNNCFSSVYFQSEDSLPDKQLVEFHLLLVDVCPFITDAHLKVLTFSLYIHYFDTVGSISDGSIIRWVPLSSSVSALPTTLSGGAPTEVINPQPGTI